MIIEAVPDSFNDPDKQREAAIIAALKEHDPVVNVYMATIARHVFEDAATRLKGAGTLDHPLVRTALQILLIPPESILTDPGAILKLIEWNCMTDWAYSISGTQPNLGLVRIAGAGAFAREAWSFVNPIVSGTDERSRKRKAREILTSAAHGNFTEDTMQRIHNPGLMESLGLVAAPSQDTLLHFSDPHFLADRPYQLLEEYSKLLPAPLFGPNPSNTVFWNSQVADIDPPQRGAFFTRDTLGSLLEQPQANVLVISRFDPKILMSEPPQDHVQAARSMLQCFDELILPQVIDNGFIMLTVGTGMDTSGFLHQLFIMELLSGILKKGTVEHSYLPYFNPFHKLYWTNKNIFKVRHVEQRQVTAISIIREAASRSILVLHITPHLREVIRTTLEHPQVIEDIAHNADGTANRFLEQRRDQRRILKQLSGLGTSGHSNREQQGILSILEEEFRYNLTSHHQHEPKRKPKRRREGRGKR